MGNPAPHGGMLAGLTESIVADPRYPRLGSKKASVSPTAGAASGATDDERTGGIHGHQGVECNGDIQDIVAFVAEIAALNDDVSAKPDDVIVSHG